MSEILRAKVKLQCPSCGRTLQVTLGDVKAGRTVRCPGGHVIHLRQQGNGIGSADRALDDFKRSLVRLNRRLGR
jgi:hypothetical protein